MQNNANLTFQTLRCFTKALPLTSLIGREKQLKERFSITVPSRHQKDRMTYHLSEMTTEPSVTSSKNDKHRRYGATLYISGSKETALRRRMLT
jgi:hypothetical protein